MEYISDDMLIRLTLNEAKCRYPNRKHRATVERRWKSLGKKRAEYKKREREREKERVLDKWSQPNKVAINKEVEKRLKHWKERLIILDLPKETGAKILVRLEGDIIDFVIYVYPNGTTSDMLWLDMREEMREELGPIVEKVAKSRGLL
jgi:hypothetical protein